jgi:hypothetical protein
MSDFAPVFLRVALGLLFAYRWHHRNVNWRRIEARRRQADEVRRFKSNAKNSGPWSGTHHE